MIAQTFFQAPIQIIMMSLKDVKVLYLLLTSLCQSLQMGCSQVQCTGETLEVIQQKRTGTLEVRMGYFTWEIRLLKQLRR